MTDGSNPITHDQLYAILQPIVTRLLATRRIVIDIYDHEQGMQHHIQELRNDKFDSTGDLDLDATELLDLLFDCADQWAREDPGK